MAGNGSVLPSVMKKDFSKIPAPRVQRSLFNRSRGYKTTFDAGWLVPFLVEEILPGDTMNLMAHIFARLSTLQFPIMDNVFLDTFYFFVPNRLVWNNWEKFQGSQNNPGDSIDYEIPVLSDDEMSFDAQSLGDYFGLPVGFTIDGYVNSLPFRAYNLVWNEWFRDQNLQGDVVVDKDDGPDLPADYVLLRRGKRHDYFTSCLPWPQKGDAISIPLGTSAPVYGTGKTVGFTDGTDNYGMSLASGTNAANFSESMYNVNIGNAQNVVGPGAGLVTGITTDRDKSGMAADLSMATAATINELREAFAFQQVLETDARSGTRYTEILQGRFGVTVPDFRLQRPEYLGGGSQHVDVRAVAQTTFQGTPTIEDAKGSLAAYSQVGARSGFVRSFVEHGYVIGLVNVRADITYQDKIDRMWSRRTRFDFYMPELAHIGEQSVLNMEIFYNAVADPLAVFGYQERWAEYRYGGSQVTGKFRSNYATPLDAWHLALDFSAQPVLNSSFIVDDPPIDRIVAVPAEPHVLFDSYIDIKHARAIPVYSVPGLTRL